MARSRNIKPGFFSNDDLSDCQPLARLLFIGLWCVADREGRMEDRPRRIRAEILPYDDCDIEDLLDELHQNGFILRYEVGAEKFIQVLNFGKHQNPHMKEAKSTIPAPDQNDHETVEPEVIASESRGELEADNSQAPEQHYTSTVQEPEGSSESPADSGFLIPDSGFLIPDSSTTANAVAVADAPPERIPKTKSPPRKTRLPDDFLLTPERASRACDHWQTKSRGDLSALDEFDKFRNHHTQHGKAMACWESAWRTWYANAVTFSRPPGQQQGFLSAHEKLAKATESITDYEKSLDF